MRSWLARTNTGFLSGWLLLSLLNLTRAEEWKVPGCTAYLFPNANSARITEEHGVTQWSDRSQSVNWYGRFESNGTLTAKVGVHLPMRVESRLELTVDGQTHQATVSGLGSQATVLADFGRFEIREASYHRFSLKSLNERRTPFGDIESLILDGPAMENAHFNLKERRNAASVHLMYPVPKETKVEAFYCEVTAIEDPVATFYMACGWHRGYFGMQVNSPTERRIIFSVWDSGGEAIDRDKVDDSNRVKLIDKGLDVFTGDFGHEGTGGHSHLKHQWKTGVKQRFLVTAKAVDETHTNFSGYWFRSEQQVWMLISSWLAPKEGGLIKGPHSFSENFSGANGNLLRKALYGNQWIRDSDGNWIELTNASFSHDPTGKTDRLDRFMGLQENQFFLSHGGFVTGFSPFGEKHERLANKHAPNDLDLPAIGKKGVPLGGGTK